MVAALASLFFGATVFATRFAMRETDAFTLALLRFGIGAVLLAPMLVRYGQRFSGAELRSVLILGVLSYALMPIALGEGLRFTYSSRAALIMASHSFMTLLLARWRGDEEITLRKLLGIALTLAGLAVGLTRAPSTHGDPNLWLGDALVFVAALCTAIYNVYARPLLRHHPPLVVTAGTMTAGALATVPLAAAAAWTHGLPSFTAPGWAAVLFIGTFGAAIGYGLWVWALRATTPSRVAVFLALNPLAATVLGVAYLGEPLGPEFILGMVIVWAGILVVVGSPAPSAAASDRAPARS